MSNPVIPVSKIRLLLEYRSFPMWLCDKNWVKVDEGLVEELADDFWLKNELETIQNIYNGLFIDNKVEFRYVGFSSSDDKERFDMRVKSVYEYIRDRLGDRYPIRYDM